MTGWICDLGSLSRRILEVPWGILEVPLGILGVPWGILEVPWGILAGKTRIDFFQPQLPKCAPCVLNPVFLKCTQCVIEFGGETKQVILHRIPHRNEKCVFECVCVLCVCSFCIFILLADLGVIDSVCMCFVCMFVFYCSWTVCSYCNCVFDFNCSLVHVYFVLSTNNVYVFVLILG